MFSVQRLTLEEAVIMIDAAKEEADRIGVKHVICISDDGGYPIALHRMTQSRITGVEIAMAKAFTAAGHQRATHLFNEPPSGPALPGNEAFGINHMHPGKFAIFVGGFPIVYEDKVIGGVGISGGNGAQDKAVGAAALKAFEEKIAVSS